MLSTHGIDILSLSSVGGQPIAPNVHHIIAHYNPCGQPNRISLTLLRKLSGKNSTTLQNTILILEWSPKRAPLWNFRSSFEVYETQDPAFAILFCNDNSFQTPNIPNPFDIGEVVRATNLLRRCMDDRTRKLNFERRLCEIETEDAIKAADVISLPNSSSASENSSPGYSTPGTLTDSFLIMPAINSRQRALPATQPQNSQHIVLDEATRRLEEFAISERPCATNFDIGSGPDECEIVKGRHYHPGDEERSYCVSGSSHPTAQKDPESHHPESQHPKAQYSKAQVQGDEILDSDLYESDEEMEDLDSYWKWDPDAQKLWHKDEDGEVVYYPEEFD